MNDFFIYRPVLREDFIISRIWRDSLDVSESDFILAADDQMGQHFLFFLLPSSSTRQ